MVLIATGFEPNGYDDDDDDGGDDDDDDDGGAFFLRNHHQIRLHLTRVQTSNTKRCSKSLRWMKSVRTNLLGA